MAHEPSNPSDRPISRGRWRRRGVALMACVVIGVALTLGFARLLPSWIEGKIVATAARRSWTVDWKTSSWRWNGVSLEEISAERRGVSVEIPKTAVEWSLPDVAGGTLRRIETQGATVAIDVPTFLPPRPEPVAPRPRPPSDPLEPPAPKPTPVPSAKPLPPPSAPPQPWWRAIPADTVHLADATFCFEGEVPWKTEGEVTYRAQEGEHAAWVKLDGGGLRASGSLRETGDTRDWTAQGEGAWKNPLETARGLIPARWQFAGYSAADVFNRVRRWESVHLDAIAMGTAEQLNEAALLVEGEGMTLAVPGADSVVRVPRWVGAARGNSAQWELNFGCDVAPWEVAGWQGPAFQVNFQRETDGSVLLETPRLVWGHPILGIQGETTARLRGSWAALFGQSERGLELQVAMESLRVIYGSIAPFRLFAQVSSKALSGRLSPLQLVGFSNWSLVETHFVQTTADSGHKEGNASGRWERAGDAAPVANWSAQWDLDPARVGKLEMVWKRPDETTLALLRGVWGEEGVGLGAEGAIDFATDSRWLHDLPLLREIEFDAGTVDWTAETAGHGHPTFAVKVADKLDLSDKNGTWKWRGLDGEITGVLLPVPQTLKHAPWSATRLEIGLEEKLVLRNLTAWVRMQGLGKCHFRMVNADLLGGQASFDRTTIDFFDEDGSVLVELRGLTVRALREFQPELPAQLSDDATVSGALALDWTSTGWTIRSLVLSSQDGAWTCRLDTRERATIPDLTALVRALKTALLDGELPD